MNLLSMQGVEKTYGDSPLFTDVAFGIEEGERIGLVGRNGTGKSVLLELLGGGVEPDAGIISRKRLLRIAKLEQNPFGDDNSTLIDFFTSGKTHIFFFRRNTTKLSKRLDEVLLMTRRLRA